MAIQADALASAPTPALGPPPPQPPPPPRQRGAEALPRACAHTVVLSPPGRLNVPLSMGGVAHAIA